MAYYNIEKRLKSDGTPRYRCNVIIKEKGVITYRESKTFPKHAHAKTWGTQKVMELDLYGIPSSNAVDGLTVRDLLHKYLNDPNAADFVGVRDPVAVIFAIPQQVFQTVQLATGVI